MNSSKYGNRKTIIDGIAFDSKKEAERYCELKLMKRAGAIRDLKLQPEFILQDSFKKNGVTYRKIVYRADFAYIDVKSKKMVVEDVKGCKTEIYKLKKKLFEYKYPSLTIVEV